VSAKTQKNWRELYNDLHNEQDSDQPMGIVDPIAQVTRSAATDRPELWTTPRTDKDLREFVGLCDGERQVKPITAIQEKMMSPSIPAKIEGEFTKWIGRWMLRSERSRTSPSWKSKTNSKKNVRKIQENTSPVESAIVERGEKATMDKSKDQDRGKGAMEQDQQNQGGNTSMQGQLGHRDEDAELKNADTDLSG